MTANDTFDIVVAGAGNAGIVAAIAAREAGARVLLLEASGIEERGGNSRYATAVFRTVHNGVDDLSDLIAPDLEVQWGRVETAPYTSEDYVSDVVADATPKQVAPDLVETFVGRSLETARWLRDHDVTWNLVTRPTPEGSDPEGPIRLPRGGELAVRGRGLGLVETLFGVAERAGVTIRYNSFAEDILIDGDNPIRIVLRSDDVPVTIVAPTVIVASGGYEASAGARSKYLGPGWERARVRGTRFNTGLLLERLIEQGAGRKGDWTAAHSVPVDISSPEVGDMTIGDSTARYSFPYGITVNSAGERFTDEGIDEIPFAYSKFGKVILAQPDGVAFQIFDSKTTHLLEPRYESATRIVANSIEELATAAGIQADGLIRTVNDFNSGCHAGTFDPGVKDGLAASPGGQPKKSNWAQPIDTAPFVAYPVTCGITFTSGGGIATDAHARVLDDGGDPIPGLLAIGEIAGGFLRDTVPTGCGLMRGAAMALIAAETATQMAHSPR